MFYTDNWAPEQQSSLQRLYHGLVLLGADTMNRPRLPCCDSPSNRQPGLLTISHAALLQLGGTVVHRTMHILLPEQ